MKYKGEIARVFGNSTLVYIKNIVEKGKLDYVTRLPESLLIKIVSFLSLEDISRLSQVNCMFRQVKFNFTKLILNRNIFPN